MVIDCMNSVFELITYSLDDDFLRGGFVETAVEKY